MNLTLSVDEQLVERAREAARARGTSLNALIREYLELLAGNSDGEQVLAVFEQLWETSGRSTKRFDRDSLYEERLERYKSR